MNKCWIKRNILGLFIKLLLVVLLVFSSAQQSHAQFSVNKRHKGVYGAKKKYLGKQTGKKNRAYKPTSKTGKKKAKINRKRLKQRKNRKKRRNNYVRRKRKNSLKGRSKSLYGGKKSNKRRKGKGRYPKRKSDLGSKVSLTMFSGVVITGQEDGVNEAGQVDNVFANYQPAPSIGMGVEYNYTPNLSFGANIQAIPLARDNYRVRAVSLAVEAKYYLGNKRAKVRPYGLIGATYSFAGIRQDGFENFRSLDNGKLTPEFSVQEEQDILVESIDKVEPEIQTGLIPMFGYKIGIGADYKLNNTWSVYAELDYHSSIANASPAILEFFPQHRSNFNFMTFKVGAKLNFLKSKSLY